MCRQGGVGREATPVQRLVTRRKAQATRQCAERGVAGGIIAENKVVILFVCKLRENCPLVCKTNNLGS